MSFTILVPESTRIRLSEYRISLTNRTASPGTYLARQFALSPEDSLSDDGFLKCILNTKHPQIFAESAVTGDGSDWTLPELGILGDISIAIPVTIFDDGRHSSPSHHPHPFPGTLVFTPGALLRNGRGSPPADWEETTHSDGSLDSEAYYRLYERRLLPVFEYIEESAAALGKPALITLPGLGCGQFAGPFHGQLGAALLTTLVRFLESHASAFPSIKAVYYDPFRECSNARFEIHGLSLMVRPLMQGNTAKPQLCPPHTYEEPGDDFSQCHLFSIVAWDHVSWPGNDFFAGSRCTDDGVKAAATDSMFALTGIRGNYSPQRAAYLPPPPFHTWEEVVLHHHLRLQS